MKVIIAGGRDRWVSDAEIKTAIIESGFDVSEIVCGGAKGIDDCALQYGIKNGIKTTIFPAEWHIHGDSAGPIRNHEMSLYSDALIVFVGGRGTQNIVNAMKRLNKPIFDVGVPE